MDLRHWRGFAATAIAASAMLIDSSVALADETSPRRAYDRGTDAYARGDYGAAAREFAHADALSPSPVALQAAIDAAVLADDPVLGTELLERSRRAPPSPELALILETARARFAHRAGKIRLACKTCVASIDGTPLSPNVERVVSVGAHTAIVDESSRIALVRADEIVTLAGAPRPAVLPHPANADPTSGISPAWFFIGAGVTAALAGGSALSALDTQRVHDRFVDGGCERRGGPTCGPDSDAGRAAETRTNVLVISTLAAGAATAALLFLVRWQHTPVALDVAPTGAALRFAFQ